MSNIETLTHNTLTDTLGQPGILVSDFWAPWRRPCHTMAPQFERAARLRPQCRFAKVNVDEQPTVANAFQIPLIPTLGAVDQLAPTQEPETALQEAASR